MGEFVVVMVDSIGNQSGTGLTWLVVVEAISSGQMAQG